MVKMENWAEETSLKSKLKITTLWLISLPRLILHDMLETSECEGIPMLFTPKLWPGHLTPRLDHTMQGTPHPGVTKWEECRLSQARGHGFGNPLARLTLAHICNHHWFQRQS